MAFIKNTKQKLSWFNLASLPLDEWVFTVPFDRVLDKTLTSYLMPANLNETFVPAYGTVNEDAF